MPATALLISRSSGQMIARLSVRKHLGGSCDACRTGIAVGTEYWYVPQTREKFHHGCLPGSYREVRG